MTFVPNADDLILRNQKSAANHDPTVAKVPSRGLAVVACMDARIDVLTVLGLVPGEAHVIRNAGGVITDDTIRSVVVSQRSLGTQEVILLHHTDCGLQTVDGLAFIDELEAETGVRPAWTLEDFSDPFVDVEESIGQLQRSPFLLHKEHIRGFVYDVSDGLLYETFGSSAN